MNVTQNQSTFKLTDSRKFVGWYAHFDGTAGRELMLHANGTYDLRYHQDVSDRSDPKNERHKSFGIWFVQRNGAIVISPRDSNRKRRYLTASVEFFPVPWGKRLYLVEPNEFIVFRDAVAFGKEPRGKYGAAPLLLREGDEARPAPGLPVFPEHWKYLLSGVRRRSQQ